MYSVAYIKNILWMAAPNKNNFMLSVSLLMDGKLLVISSVYHSSDCDVHALVKSHNLYCILFGT